ncbi:uncharacterized protein [Ptychodera flava]|uniref:uncharacterized protein isoform X1 n=1 Tax=Ptychodera flava TaxID=63121 RepID=UPI00396A8C9E
MAEVRVAVQATITACLWLFHLTGHHLAPTGSEKIKILTSRLILPVQEHERVSLQVEVQSSFPLTSNYYLYARAGIHGDNLNMDLKIQLNSSEGLENTLGCYSMTYRPETFEHTMTVVIEDVSWKHDNGDWEIHTMIFQKNNETFLMEDTYRFSLAVQRKDSEKGRKRRKCQGNKKSTSKKNGRRTSRRMRKRKQQSNAELQHGKKSV